MGLPQGSNIGWGGIIGPRCSEGSGSTGGGSMLGSGITLEAEVGGSSGVFDEFGLASSLLSVDPSDFSFDGSPFFRADSSFLLSVSRPFWNNVM